tara:strand:+ start:1626 stop:2135 length:510 start_codon:yes stop_codon:yes gene_type:complete
MKWNKDLIIVKDNFFKKTLFKKIYADLDKVKFVNRFTHATEKGDQQKIYFDVHLGPTHPGCIALKSFFKEELGVNVKALLSYYFLSTKHEKPTIHTDLHKINCIIYLKGQSQINNGTGFYEKKKGTYVLNSHIGFKENRAVFFRGDRKHASLQFAQGATGRYIMTNFIK